VAAVPSGPNWTPPPTIQIKKKVFRTQDGIQDGKYINFYDKTNSNTCAMPPNHSLGFPSYTTNIKPVTNCDSLYKHCLVNQNATQLRSLPFSILHHQMQTINAHIKETPLHLKALLQILNSRAWGRALNIWWQGINKSPEARNVTGFCGISISSYGKVKVKISLLQAVEAHRVVRG
jgi:hypothetical protein